MRRSQQLVSSQHHALLAHARPLPPMRSLVGEPMRAMFPLSEFPSNLKFTLTQGDPLSGKFLLGAQMTMVMADAGLIPALQLQAEVWATTCAEVTLHLRMLKTVQVCMYCVAAWALWVGKGHCKHRQQMYQALYICQLAAADVPNCAVVSMARRAYGRYFYRIIVGSHWCDLNIS